MNDLNRDLGPGVFELFLADVAGFNSVVRDYRRILNKLYLVPSVIGEDRCLKPRLDSDVITYHAIGTNEVIFSEVFTVKQGEIKTNQVGTWDNNLRQLTWDTRDIASRRKNLVGTEFVAGVIKAFPFVTFPNFQKLENQSDIQGYVIDILDIMKATYGFGIKYVLSRDLEYGTDFNGTWNGLVGMLLNHEIDFTAAILSMTYERHHGKTMPFDVINIF